MEIHGAVLHADAIVEAQDEMMPGMDHHRWRRSGIAIKAIDEDGKADLNSRLFTDSVNRFFIQVVGGLTLCSFLVLMSKQMVTATL